MNVPDAGQIAVVDLAAGNQVATWRVPGLKSNFPMALDRTGERAAVVFRSPARLVLLDTKSGAVAANIETCSDADDVFFDARRQRIYVSCGEGARGCDAGASRQLPSAQAGQNDDGRANVALCSGIGSAFRGRARRIAWIRL